MPIRILDHVSVTGVAGIIATLSFEKINLGLAFMTGGISVGYMATRWIILLRHEWRRIKHERERDALLGK